MRLLRWKLEVTFAEYADRWMITVRITRRKS